MIKRHDHSELNELFVARTHHWRIHVDATDHMTGSRIGGRAPAQFGTDPASCPRCGDRLQYVLTLAEDILQPAIARGRAVSLFCCRIWDCLWESQSIVDVPSVVLLAHEDQPRASSPTLVDSPANGLGIHVGELVREEIDEDMGRVFVDYTKLGGSPGYIQSWGPREEEKAHATGKAFLFQYSYFPTPQCPPGYEAGADPFGFGVVYVFSRIDPETRLPALTDFAAFWQLT